MSARARETASVWGRLLVFVVVGVLVWLIGPWAALAALVFVHPRLRPVRKGRALGVGVLVLVLAVGLLAGAFLMPQSGRLPIPPGMGQLSSPAYLGRPAKAQPISVDGLPQHPFMAANGGNSMHNDASATDAYVGLGPLGNSPQVDSAWYGIKECATLMFNSDNDLIGLCGDRTGPVLNVIDPETMELTSTRRLPPRPKTGGSPLENICGGAYSYLDNRDRVVVATSDRSIKMYSSTLEPLKSWPVTDAVPAGDCLIALMPDWEGNIWFASKGGRVGHVAPRSGKVAGRDLGERIVNSLAADRNGVYVVSERALYKFAKGADGVQRWWRSRYDRGTEHKPGQLSQGSGTTPTLIDGGLVAITDNADPRMNVLMIDAATGERRCSVPVFKDDISATENSLISLGDAVVVENNYGYHGPQSTMLGRSTPGGVARVSHDCKLEWTAEVAGPTSVAKASLAAGLVYVYEKRANRWGVNAWYLTGIDARTGRAKFHVRTGIGTLFNNHYAAITLAPDGSAYVATLAGLVRVRDRA